MSEERPKRKLYPTLSEQGYIEDTRLILARILSYYITTEVQQSFTYRYNIVTLPKAYHEGINDPEKFKQILISDFSKLLNYHYEVYEVEAETVLNKDGVTFNVFLYASVVDDDNKKYSFGNLTTYDGKVLGKLIEVSNYGTGKEMLRSMYK